MKRHKKLLIGATVALALTAAGQAAYHYSHRPTSTAMASWAFHPSSMDQLRNEAAVIVLAEVVSVRRGDDIVTTQPKEPDGVDRIPTQRVPVRVVKAYKGDVAPGQELTVFRTGGAALPPPPPASTSAQAHAPQVLLEGDPPYHTGTQQLLMLTPGPQGTLRPVSPEGRYQHDPRSGRLTPTVENAVTRQVASSRLSELEPSLRQ